jgi:protein gp37
MADLFYKRPDKIITRVCATIALSAHIGELLTKRTPRMAHYFAALDPRTVALWQPKLLLGFSAENQEWFDRRWADMRPLAELGWFIFVSLAPMIGPVRLPPDLLALGRRAWVIVAGEQGRHRDCRDMDPIGASGARSMQRSQRRVFHEANGAWRSYSTGFANT